MLIVVGSLDCVGLVTTVVNWCNVVMGVMSSSNNIMDLIGLLGISLASLVFLVVIFEGDDVSFLVTTCHTEQCQMM